jgi:thymidine phosphorylase
MSGAFSAVDVIRAKRDGHALTDEQVDWFIEAYTAGDVSDEQASALLMAIYFQGMAPAELRRWTAAMIASGERLDLSEVGRPTVDKHSTGGVGDKVSLVLAPLVAACGAAMPQLSGRGLGHTGGTLDKMESIPGWRASLERDEILRTLQHVGAVICAAGPGLAPADAKLYALRDVTGTVESIPLIASSIMSKKIAEGTSALVLDVKVGTGAFMKDEARARALSEKLVELGEAHDVRTSALLTDMDTPLGRAAGNALEVAEAVEMLEGGGPPDVVEVTLALAREMLDLVGLDDVDPEAALADGQAMNRWRAMVTAQGGDPDVPLAVAPEQETVKAESDGYVQRLWPSG